MRGTLQIHVTETPDGDYLAQCGGVSAVGATAAEAENLVRDLLRMQREEHPFGYREPLPSDFDQLPELDDN